MIAAAIQWMQALPAVTLDEWLYSFVNALAGWLL